MNTTNNYFRISIAILKKYKYLTIGEHSGVIELNISHSIHPRKLIVGVLSNIREDGGLVKIIVPDSYHTRTEGENINNIYHIAILHTPCNYGGTRQWFMCPHSGKRCSVLYANERGVLGSRKELGLVYPQQIEPKSFRGYRKMLGVSMEEIMELQASIKYPYRNGKPTRKQRKLMNISRDDEALSTALRKHTYK